jgi:hypothetical protein
MAIYQLQPPENGVPAHHSALHGALALRYAASYRGVPEAVVWLEVAPFLTLSSEQSVAALAEYVVFKERPAKADRELVETSVRRGLELLGDEDRQLFVSAAREYRFGWWRLVDASGETGET